MAQPPAARGFTLAEKKGLRFEAATLYLVLGVALIAATISYQAITDAGAHMRLGHVRYLLPAAIDGFAIACSIGIIRSQAAGDRAVKRLSEWAGLSYALIVSILGNVYHVLGDGYPAWLKILMASSIPLIVAYGLHVYGRAQSTGISAHVMADDPNKVYFGLTQLNGSRTPRPDPRARPARHTAPTPRAAEPAAAEAPARQTAPRAGAQDAFEAAYLAYRAAREDGRELGGNDLAALLGCHPGHARNVRNSKFRPRYQAERAAAAAEPRPADPVAGHAAPDAAVTELHRKRA